MGSTTTAAGATIATFFLALKARAWFECIPTDDNPADGFSREGWDCALVRKMLAMVEIRRVRLRAPPDIEHCSEVWDLLEALG